MSSCNSRRRTWSCSWKLMSSWCWSSMWWCCMFKCCILDLGVSGIVCFREGCYLTRWINHIIKQLNHFKRNSIITLMRSISHNTNKIYHIIITPSLNYITHHITYLYNTRNIIIYSHYIDSIIIQNTTLKGRFISNPSAVACLWFFKNYLFILKCQSIFF